MSKNELSWFDYSIFWYLRQSTDVNMLICVNQLTQIGSFVWVTSFIFIFGNRDF